MKTYKVWLFVFLTVVICFQNKMTTSLALFHLAPKTIIKGINTVLEVNLTNIYIKLKILKDDKTKYNQSQIRKDKFDVEWLSHKDMSIAPINTARDVRKISVQLINQAQSEILIEMNKLNDPTVWEALLNRAKEGINVKIIIGASRSLLSKKELEFYDEIVAQSNKIDSLEICFYDSKKEKDKFVRRNVFPVDNHRKMIVTDGIYAHVGSCNIEAWYENKSAGLILYSPKEVGKFRQFFYNTWSVQTGDKDVSSQRISNLKQLSSDNFSILHEKSVVSNVKFNIIHEFLKAKKHIYIAQWGFTDKLLIELLIAKKRLNPEIDIKVVLNPTTVGFGKLANKLPYLKNLPAYLKLKKGGIDVRWGGDGTNSDKADDYEHRKVIVCDNIVITGSADGWERGLQVNAELSVSLENEQLANHFVKEIQEIWVKDLSKAKYSKPIEYISTLLVTYMQETKRNINNLDKFFIKISTPIKIFFQKSINLFVLDIVNFEYSRSLRTESTLPLVNVMLSFVAKEDVPNFLELSSVFFKKNISDKLIKTAALIKYGLLKNKTALALQKQNNQNIYDQEVFISISSAEVESAKITGAVAPTVDWKKRNFGVSLTPNKYEAFSENIKKSMMDETHSVVSGKISKDAKILFFNQEEKIKFYKWAEQFEITEDKTFLFPSYLKLKGYDGYALINDKKIAYRFVLFNETMFELSQVISTPVSSYLTPETMYVFNQENKITTDTDTLSLKQKTVRNIAIAV